MKNEPEIKKPSRRYRFFIDAALITLLGLLALAGVLASATGGEQVAVLLLGIVLSAAAAVIGSLLVGYRFHTKRPAKSAVVIALISLLVIISVAVTHWPMRASYALSRHSLEKVAWHLWRGERVATPLRAGVFIIQRAEISDQGIACLWTDPESGGRTGFVQCRRDHVPFNLWSMISLDNRWQFIHED